MHTVAARTCSGAAENIERENAAENNSPSCASINWASFRRSTSIKNTFQMDYEAIRYVRRD